MTEEATEARQRWAAAAVAAALACAVVVSLLHIGSGTLTGRLSISLGLARWQATPKLYPKLPDRLPASRLSKWREFAAARKCSLEDESYSQIFSDLEPFRRTGGLNDAAVAAAAALLPAATAVLEVRGGRAQEAAGSAEGGGGSPSGRRRGRLPWGGLGYYRRLVADFEADLPDMKLLFNFGDKPRSWVGALPARDEAALRAGQLSAGAAWERHGCDAAVGAGMRRRHGLFQRGSGRAFFAQRGPLPVLSGWRVEGCFSDILVPHAWNNKGNITRLTLSSGCPLSQGSWQNKSDVAYWRGSSTGAHVPASMPPDVWQTFHRQRLVDLSQQHPAHLDAAFTRFVQCDPPACAAMQARYGAAPYAAPSQLFSHKYTLVVDGNGAAARLGPTLCSGSVAFNAQLFREWFVFRLQPFKHFVPVRSDYEDLLDQIEWARQHDAEAQAIAAAATRFVNKQLRREDMQCYLYRLLLEYGAIYQHGASGNSTSSARNSSSGGGGGNGAGSSSSSAMAAAREQQAAVRERPP